MLNQGCPGPVSQSVPDEVECPACGAAVEMWSNETKVKCPSCSKEITRDELKSQA